MAEIYKHKVSIYMDMEDQLYIRYDPKGSYNHLTANQLYQKLVELQTQLGARFWVHKPESRGDTPVLFKGRDGKPYLALLPAEKAPGTVVTTVLINRNREPRKLA